MYVEPCSRSRSCLQILDIKTYAVTPLNEECGLIEWIDNLKTLRDILLKLYKQKDIPIKVLSMPQYRDVELRLIGMWCSTTILEYCWTKHAPIMPSYLSSRRSSLESKYGLPSV